MKKGLTVKVICLALGLCLLASMLAIACGTTKPATTTQAAITTTPAKTTAPTVATTPAAPKPVSGGTLRYGLNQDMPTIGNPASQTYVSGWGPISDICLESLLILNAKGEPKPWLASAWKWDSNNLGITLTLQPGVKFHDGTPFDAAAVKWNIEQCIAANTTEFSSVKSIDIIDNVNLKLNLKQTDGMLITNFAGARGLMMSPTAYEKAGTTNKERSAWAEQNPVGTGPFKFVSWQKTVKIVFDRFTGYWQPGKPYLDRVEFTIINDEATLLASFQAGELDMMITGQPQNIQVLEKTGKYNFYKGDVRLIGGLEGDSKHPNSPWANIKVRQAAAYSVDNDAFAKAMGFGYWVPTNQYDVPGRWGYNPDVVGYPYNVTKAKQLMTEAGYANGFSTVIYGMSHYATMLASLQNFFSAIGIKAEAKIVTPAERVNMFGTGWDGMWIWEGNPQPTSAYQMVRNFTAAAAPKRLASVDIPADFSALVAKIGEATDFETQKALTWQVQKDMIDKYAFITFIYGQYTATPMQKKAHDVFNNVSMHWTPWDAWLEK